MTEALTTTLLIATGLATRYAPDVMDTVEANRLRWNHITPCPECVGRVALLDCGRLDERVWIGVPGRGIVGPVHVVDCGAAHDVSALQAKGFAVDLGYELAVRLGVVDAPLGGVTVWKAHPRRGWAADPRPRSWDGRVRGRRVR